MSRFTITTATWGVAWLAASVAAAVGAAEPVDLASFLAAKQIAASDRAVLATAGGWGEEQERMLVRVLARLPAPPSLADRWAAEAATLPSRGTPAVVEDRLVRIRGRATAVVPRLFSPEAATLAGHHGFDVVRVIDEGGAIVDVIVTTAPKGWPRSVAIDEPTTVVGLPLSGTGGPRPADADGAQPPSLQTPPDRVVAATALAWHPPTLLSRLGMNYALFDTVTDGRRLEAGDTAAFWGVMAAASHAAPGEIARDAGGPTEILPLIDPQQKWFAMHRGDPVVIEGVARCAKRIAIDEAGPRSAIGHSHYWELEVFADTPLLRVDGRDQDRYPVVCCVVTLPEGMPTGDVIDERVRVAGFGFKRYRYAIGDGSRTPSGPGDTGGWMESPLVIAPGLEWVPPPSAGGASNLLFGVFAALLAVVAAALAVNTWRTGRDARQAARRRHDALPDRIDVPPA